jgi:hypothetical protein
MSGGGKKFGSAFRSIGAPKDFVLVKGDTRVNRPDFAGFAKALREEAQWSATIHANDRTGQAASDQRSLNRLAEKVELVGKRLGFI